MQILPINSHLHISEEMKRKNLHATLAFPWTEQPLGDNQGRGYQLCVVAGQK
jgi:hypothetical protein